MSTTENNKLANCCCGCLVWIILSLSLMFFTRNCDRIPALWMTDSMAENRCTVATLAASVLSINGSDIEKVGIQKIIDEIELAGVSVHDPIKDILESSRYYQNVQSHTVSSNEFYEENNLFSITITADHNGKQAFAGTFLGIKEGTKMFYGIDAIELEYNGEKLSFDSTRIGLIKFFDFLVTIGRKENKLKHMKIE